MTIEEIKNKINAAIRGQGTNIDAGGALADILEGICNNIPNLGGGYTVRGGFTFAHLSFDDAVMLGNVTAITQVSESGGSSVYLRETYGGNLPQYVFEAIEDSAQSYDLTFDEIHAVWSLPFWGGGDGYPLSVEGFALIYNGNADEYALVYYLYEQ